MASVALMPHEVKYGVRDALCEDKFCVLKVFICIQSSNNNF